MNLLKISWRNLIARPGATTLSLLLLVLGVGLISFVLHFSRQIEENLKKNGRGIDLVVGAKGSPLQLVLSAVYHIDKPTGNISLGTADSLLEHPLISEGLPLAYGDNFKGYRILGSDTAILRWYGARLESGRAWTAPLEIVAGAAVAKDLGIKEGQKIVSNHGLAGDMDAHDDAPFVVTGILAPTGGVLDQLLLTDVASLWAVHAHSGPEPDSGVAEKPKEITAMLVRSRNAFGILALPRLINETTKLMAASPAIEISRLANLLGFGEKTLRGLAWIILVVSALSVFISLYSSLRERRYEMALMRSMGGKPWVLFVMVLLEGLMLSVTGFILGMFASRAGLYFTSQIISRDFHYDVFQVRFLQEEGELFVLILAIGLLAAALPAYEAARTPISRTLADA